MGKPSEGDRRASSRSQDSERVALSHPGKSRPQITASLIATIGTFCSGSVLAWTSTANPQLKKTEDIGQLTDSELSLIASIAVIGALISGFAAGFSIDRIGRKLTIILLVIPFVIGWMLVTFSPNLATMLAGRFVTGFCAGAYTLAVPVYISEITQDRLRGSMGNCMVVSLVMGILFSYIIGSVVSWQWSAVISAIIPICYAIAMIFVPDTPRYLITKNRQSEAAASLRWLRGAATVNDVDEELNDITHSVESSASYANAGLTTLLTARTIKPIAICLTLMVFQQFGGINAVIFFTVDIFKAAGSDIDPNIASIIVGVVQVVSVIISTLLVDRVGRKVLMFLSETGMAIGLAALGLFFYLKHLNDDKTPENLGWLPLLSMTLYIVTYNLGCASLPWTFMSELCPNHIKGLASAIVTSSCWFLAFIVTFTFADLRVIMGDHFVFWIFCIFSILGALFSLFILPETKGKSLDEIQNLF